MARRRAGSVIQEGHFVDRSQVVSNRLGDNDRAKPSASGSGVESVPPSGAAPSPPEILGRSPETRAVFTGTKPPPLGAPLPPPDRNHRPPLGSAPAAPEAPFEVENLHCASPAMKRGRRHCGKLTLKIYTKGERVLRIEAVAHNTRELNGLYHV